MNSRLTFQRCLHHPQREAVARCPECTRFFCRECIVEHEARVICAGCLAKIASSAPIPARKLRFRALIPVGTAGAGLLIAWLVFYFLGRALLEVPDDFHASKLWKADWLQGN